MTRRKPLLVANLYNLANEAVEAGVAYGIRRADKHAGDDECLTSAQRERVERAVIDAVMLELCERFRFDDDNA
jgi:hypothetical protein